MQTSRRNEAFNQRVTDHRRYKRKCARRIRPLVLLLAVGTTVSGLTLWNSKALWPLALLICGFPVFFTLKEVTGYIRHSRVLRSLHGSS